MKTAELAGNTLSYTVTMLEMPHLVWGKTIGLHHASNQIIVPELPEPYCYSPYSTWAQCGLIIERENIFLMKNSTNQWVSIVHKGNPIGIVGHTPLEAAMRCYVSSRLGDEIEMPEELK